MKVFSFITAKRGEQQKKKKKIDTYHRRSLWNILGIKWNKGNWLTNWGAGVDNIRSKIKLNGLNSCIQLYSRLRFLGHIARLDEIAPAKVSLMKQYDLLNNHMANYQTIYFQQLKNSWKSLILKMFIKPLYYHIIKIIEEIWSQKQVTCQTT